MNDLSTVNRITQAGAATVHDPRWPLLHKRLDALIKDTEVLAETTARLADEITGPDVAMTADKVANGPMPTQPGLIGSLLECARTLDSLLNRIHANVGRLAREL